MAPAGGIRAPLGTCSSFFNAMLKIDRGSQSNLKVSSHLSLEFDRCLVFIRHGVFYC